jgi:3-oxoacyl-[acyl-carrier-protein] synthase-3
MLKIDPETLDYIIFAHNFGNVKKGAIQTDLLPSLASRVKHDLRIKNPKCVAYDMLFGCPGWLEGVIQAQAFIKAGMAKKCLVIGAETLSRVVDLHDRDSMIYSDGAGATIIEATEEEGGILSS